MDKLKIVFPVFAILFFFSIGLASAAPIFSSESPVNSTYTYGHDADVFSINISDSNLNQTTVFNHIRVNEQGTNWTNTASTCSNLGAGNWYCSNTVSTFGSLASDGKTFIFYFDANETTGESNSSGNYFVTIDRSPPQISASFSNNSYISGKAVLGFSITDLVSGVNNSATTFFYGNATFNSTPQTFPTPYTTTLDTTAFPNNSSYSLYINTSDNIGNVNMTKYVVYVDNEAPQISIVAPAFNQTIRGFTYFQITASDAYSGLNLGSSTYTVGNSSPSPLQCAGTNFSATCTSPTINASTFSDGAYTMSFGVSDNAGNSATNSTPVVFDSNPPIVSITNPSTNSVISGIVGVTASISDLGSGVNSSQFRWENSTSNGNWTDFSCSGSSCSANLDTTLLSDGNYTLRINATDNGGLSAQQYVLIVVDNIKPNIIVTSPNVNQIISGAFFTNITITDNYGLPGTAWYSISNSTFNSTESLACVSETLQSFNCSSTVNSSLFADGPATINFSTSDLAGNNFINSINVIFDNSPPVVTNITVQPLISRVPTTFKIVGIFNDIGSDLSITNGKINLPDGSQYPFVFTKAGSDWEYSYSASQTGKYTIDVTLTDGSSHSATYSNVASFFVGVSKCGDSICDPTENYCTCPLDCQAPTCKSYEIVNCRTGIPTCVNGTGCGNGICDSSENCSTCEADCGKCSASNETGIFKIGTFQIGGSSGGNSVWIIVGVAVVGIGAALTYMFWPKKSKSVYPGFKPKESST